MNRPRFAVASFALASLFFAACTPSPEEVCKHMDELDKDSNKNCEFKMQMMKDTKREQYKKLAPCIMDAKDKAAFNACLDKHQQK